MAFELPDLPYDYEDLAPYMSRETLEYHHDKHHLAYVNKGSDLIKGTGLEDKSLEEAIVAAHGKPEHQGLFNNIAQHWNHTHFWKWMKKDGGGNKLPSELEARVNEDLGGFDSFRDKFIQAGAGQFGSGWCWLVVNDQGKFEVMNTPNGENPLHHGKTALLGCDVWEHSYYIDYRNARPKYLEAFVDNLVNWDYVAELYDAARQKLAA